ncbi:fibronectin type III domain-containing protein 7-like [Pyxicephalus adspersus]|uniref:fibronectin type III domain-containing protein 7-like n=1 Tax=Pyxicephalus adspersus TaxID=30357 RepID=UPI003B5CA718
MADIEDFTSYLVGSDGVNRTCKSSEVNCTFTGLPCGYEYNGYVYAVNKQCIGPLSQAVKVYSAPCVPMDVKTSVNGTENSVLISWNPSPGAINYTSSVTSYHSDKRNCSSEDTSCHVEELTCGEIYTTVVTAYNIMCNSGKSTASMFKSVPCPPVNLEVIVTFDLVVLSWGEAPGAVNYTSEVTGVDGETYTCHSANTSCTMTDLKCGYHYSVLVTANGEEFSSKLSHIYEFITAPCTPQNLFIDVDCVSNSATVSWNVSLGAETYSSVAVGTNGEYHICNSSSTLCDFTNLTCGISYEVTVKAINEASSSNTSLPVGFITAPCVPTLKPLKINCHDNSISLSWDKTLGAVSYTSNITSSGVNILSCTTEDSSCTIRELKCGQIYTVTVTAINNQCWSPASAPSMLTTVPCQPQNVMAKMNCNNSSTLLSWNEAPGALRYISALRGFGEELLLCNSTEQACEIHGLLCGQSYNVTVTAFNEECQSLPSTETELHTVPCVPTQLQAKVECVSNFASLYWIPSLGAENYTAKVTGPNGEEHYCHTVNSSCSFMQLSCGLLYEAMVVAVGRMCSSVVSLRTTIYTVPCVARDLRSQFQCGSEDTIISWSAVSGGIQYTATVTTQDGQSSNCSTKDTQCTVSPLQCGQIYNITVESFGVICSSRAVSPEVIQTEPCVPQNVTVDVDCELNNAMLYWNSALGSENYTAQVATTAGEEHTCHTKSTSCAVNDLLCGQTYNVMITAFNKQCQGESSHSIQLITAPCAPEVQAEVDCVTNSLEISWNQMTGVEIFTSYLTSDGGTRACNSILANCSFPSLPCGQEFNVTVSAANSQCRGPLSETVKISTVPCIPESVNTAMDCVSNSALVSWSQSSGALNYTSSLIGLQGKRYNCSSQETSCWVQDIECGEEYTLAMMAQNEVCSSLERRISVLQACPCAPQNISIFNPCDSDSVRLHWTEPLGAVHYKSTVTSSLGEIYTCETTNNTCDISGLQCGEAYDATVTVFNNQQANVNLDTKTFLTAPCNSSNIKALLHCGTSEASLLWDSAQGATSYVALVTGTDGWSGLCTSNSTMCDISALECGQAYSVSLIASNSDCNSISKATHIYSAPCVPQNVRTMVICETRITEVSWDRTPGARNYTAIIRDVNGKEYSCSTRESTCSIESLECGQTYNVIVTAHGEQCDTESTTAEFHTGPCVPDIMEVMPSCAWDFLTLSWDTALGADFYIGVLTDQNGKTLTCNTTDHSCDIIGVQCGGTYNVTVTAFSDQCSSEKSLPIMLSTAPCVPTNLISTVNCDMQSVTVSWDDAPGAMTY